MGACAKCDSCYVPGWTKPCMKTSESYCRNPTGKNDWTHGGSNGAAFWCEGWSPSSAGGGAGGKSSGNGSGSGGKFTWAGRSKNSECDMASGEKFLCASSKKVSNIDACKKSCEDAAACKSITFYSSGWCSHFSTDCTKTKADSTAISIRLSRAATTATSAGGKFKWVDRFVNTACGAGEKYLGASSKQVSDEKACKKSCEDAAACKSITFYSSGWCSHFSTDCTKTKADGNAISARLVSGQSSARKRFRKRFLRKSS